MEKHMVLVYVTLSITILQLLDEAQGVDECEIRPILQIANKCCKIPENNRTLEENRRVAEYCVKSLKADKPLPTKKEEYLEIMECVEECFFNETHILTADLKVNHTAVIVDYNQTFEKFPKWKEAAGVAVNKCIKIDAASNVRPGAKCKSGVTEFLKCFTIQLFLNCPEESWKGKDEDCVKAKKLAEKCDPKEQ